MGKSALYLWCAGFAVVTFDLILTFKLGGFTIKSYYFLFLGAAALFFADSWKAGTLQETVKQVFQGPWLFAFLLFLYELGMSPFSVFPKKSFGYSVWLLFDLLVVAIPGYYLLTKRNLFGMRVLSKALLISSVFLVSVLLIDLVAFQYGYIGGLIGNNQELSLMWGMSRAHAFSYEPSYLSLYFTFVLLFFLGQLASTDRHLSRFAIFSVGFLLLIGIFLLGSRTGWLLTGIGITALLMSAGKRVWRKDFIFGSMAVLLGIFLVLWLIPGKQITLMRQNLVGTILRGSDGSGNTRLLAIKEAVHTGIASHGVGVGVGASFFYYISRHPEVVTPYLNVSLGSENIMSTWGQIVAESGLPGLLLYAAFAVSMIATAFAAWKRSPQSRATGALVSVLLFFVIAAHLVGNVARTDVWVWFALWMALAKPPAAERA